MINRWIKMIGIILKKLWSRWVRGKKTFLKKKYLEKFIKYQEPIGGPTTISPEEKMEIRTKAAQSFLDEL
mgnify:CR=1 FL=1